MWAGGENDDWPWIAVDVPLVKTAPPVWRRAVTIVRRQPGLVVGNVLYDVRRRHETSRRRPQSQRHPTTERQQLVNSRRRIVVVVDQVAAAALLPTAEGRRRRRWKRLVMHASWYNHLVLVKTSQVICTDVHQCDLMSASYCIIELYTMTTYKYNQNVSN